MSLIGAVKGVLEQAGPEFAYIRVGGILLEIAVPSRDLQQLGDLGTEVRLWTQLIVREDDLQLYGFVVEEDKRLFQALIGVSGVGPKVALGCSLQWRLKRLLQQLPKMMLKQLLVPLVLAEERQSESF